ncbi:GNAT family N-acetyltransferase [Streptomyces sp. NBC_01498]|uniref:GNAT family N-acetyltransferase n=1 Tax=Streptomyces sp. NBC_01498 TaxID=2975870 RepID=UPI002E7B2D48|nr:GNAT family N-acetyltransferase [Streptomyces sp. NBC_01498]WTL24092.1 GNAT family N-acetyltransferase [Streptomyces sp. NBC_01498]
MTLIAPVLPFGYHARPARADDVPAIHALITECDREVYERPRKDVGAIIADLGRPRLVPELDTVLVFDRTGSPAAWAWVDRRSEIDVHPEHRGRGLGTALLRWAQERGRQAGADRLVQIVPDGNAGAGALLRAWGYDPLLTSWLMEFRMPDEPALPRSPTGVSVRPYRDGDGPAVHLLVEDAFDEWQERRAAYEEWALRTVERPAFAPDQSALAFADGQLVGTALALDVPGADEGYLEQVAVRRSHRRLGIARLLLRHSFRAFHRAGRRSCTLWTHSDTGAVDFYRAVGMGVRHNSTVFRKELRSPAAT